jgi:hypothetical protein
MSADGALSAESVRFINLVATRRFAGGGEPEPPRGLDEALGALIPATPFARAAALAETLLRHSVFASAPLQTALLALLCQLRLDDFVLLAPQGAAAGLIRELADGTVDATVLARWVEDRAVPA